MWIAADYPFLDVFWTMIIFFCWVVWIWMMIVILTDVFRRGDIGGWAKAAWTVFLIVFPFLAALIYLIARVYQMHAVSQPAPSGAPARCDWLRRLRDDVPWLGALLARQPPPENASHERE